jgi:Predicted membrane protein (DUF2207) N-terminal domain/Predicted membrane protein (DUF2207) C-terminal domain
MCVRVGGGSYPPGMGRALAGTRTARALVALRGAGTVAVLAGTLVLLGGGPAAAAPGESISQYDTRLEVRPDGVVRITETIRYDFGTNRRHGIFRKIPDKFRYDRDHDRIYPIDGVTVTADGAATPVQQSSSDGYLTLRIGDPDHTITGSHTYVIAYTGRGAVNSFPDHEELYWNVIGHEWDVPIGAASATISGPAPVQRVSCFAGPAGSQLACGSASADGATATFTQADLSSGGGMTAVVAFPAGSIEGAGPILVRHQDLSTAFQVTPWTAAGAGGMALLGVGAAAAVGWLVGRDRRYVGLLPGLTPGYGESAEERRKPLVGAPPVSVEFVPPPLDGAGTGPPRPSYRGSEIRPGQVGTLIDEQANVLDVTATIIDFAVRRHLHIRELAGTGRYGSQDWELTRRSDGDVDFLPYERRLFDALFNGRDVVRLSQLKYTFATDLGLVRHDLYGDMVAQGWYRRSPAQTRALARGAAVAVLLGSILVTVLLGVLTHAALVGLGLVAGAIVLLAVAGRFPARTGRGSAMLARVDGFRLYIATAEAEQIKFQEREMIFSRYLPYAMVFGLADEWAGRFSEIGTVAPDGSGGGLYWYAGGPGWSMLYFHQSIGNFSTTTTGTIASTPPSASGSSGFSGGFSGGGGGGGGGGSW